MNCGGSTQSWLDFETTCFEVLVMKFFGVVNMHSLNVQVVSIQFCFLFSKWYGGMLGTFIFFFVLQGFDWIIGLINRLLMFRLEKQCGMWCSCTTSYSLLQPRKGIKPFAVLVLMLSAWQYFDSYRADYAILLCSKCSVACPWYCSALISPCIQWTYCLLLFY